jgi:hypothetical protein
MGTKISPDTVYRSSSHGARTTFTLDHNALFVNIKRYPLSLILSAFVILSCVSGCLTAEKKEVRISINDDGVSGTGKIIFTGIASSPGDSVDVVNDDFNSLIAEYYQGRKIELENKGWKNVHKKLYQENGKLMAEIDFNFDDISDLSFFRYKGSGPWMLYTVADGFFTSGQYESSNGTYLGEKLPVIFWDSTQRDLSYTMSLSTPQEPKKSLLAHYQKWLAQQH